MLAGERHGYRDESFLARTGSHGCVWCNVFGFAAHDSGPVPAYGTECRTAWGHRRRLSSFRCRERFASAFSRTPQSGEMAGDDGWQAAADSNDGSGSAGGDDTGSGAGDNGGSGDGGAEGSIGAGDGGGNNADILDTVM